MALTSLTLAWMLLAAGPGQHNDLVPINKRNFKIPILIEPSKRAQIKLLKLYVSADEGRNWSEVAVRTPDQDHFAYYAPADGVYWFTVAVVDQKDHQQPADPYKVAPNQKILVDTLSPEVKLTTAERRGDEMQISWEIKDAFPELESMRLEYRPADAPATSLWYAVPIARELTGSVKVRLDNPGATLVRLELKDQTGNVGTAQKELPAIAMPERVIAAPPATAPAGTLAGSSGSPLLSGAAPPPPPVVDPPPMPRMQPSVAESRLDPPPPGHLPPGRVESWPGMERQPIPPPYGGGPARGSDTTQRVVAWSPNTDPGPAASGLPGAYPPRGPMPNVLVVNDPQVNLEYEMKAGPSGIKKVELFLSEDDGKTWNRFAEDDDKKSPITVRMPREGVFGFRLVTTSGADLSEGPPQPGASPEIRIELDMTPPIVQMYEPKGDPLHPDTLIFSWTATDRNLADKPVTLEFAETEGNWQPIATGQPATGSLSWQLPRPLAYVLLRASAVDSAQPGGNRSVAQTASPILVDLNKPKGRIVGIAPPARKQPPTELPFPPAPR